MTPIQKWVIDPLERAVSTFAQQFLLVLGVTGTTLAGKQNWMAAADSAGFAAIIALGTSYIALIIGIKVTGYFDVVRRVLLTGVQSFFGTLIIDRIDPTVLNTNWKGALAIALLTAGIAFLKALAALPAPTIGGSAVPASVGARHAA